MEKFIYNEKGQAMPAQLVPVTKEAFGPSETTEIRWLGGRRARSRARHRRNLCSR